MLVLVVVVVVQVVAEVVIVEVVAVKGATSMVLDEAVAVTDVVTTEVVAEVETVGTTTGCCMCQAESIRIALRQTGLTMDLVTVLVDVAVAVTVVG